MDVMVGTGKREGSGGKGGVPGRGGTYDVGCEDSFILPDKEGGR